MLLVQTRLLVLEYNQGVDPIKIWLRLRPLNCDSGSRAFCKISIKTFQEKKKTIFFFKENRALEQKLSEIENDEKHVFHLKKRVFPLKNMFFKKKTKNLHFGAGAGLKLRSPGVRRWSLFDKIGSGSSSAALSIMIQSICLSYFLATTKL